MQQYAHNALNFQLSPMAIGICIAVVTIAGIAFVVCAWGESLYRGQYTECRRK